MQASNLSSKASSAGTSTSGNSWFGWFRGSGPESKAVSSDKIEVRQQDSASTSASSTSGFVYVVENDISIESFIESFDEKFAQEEGISGGVESLCDSQTQRDSRLLLLTIVRASIGIYIELKLLNNYLKLAFAFSF